MITAILARPPLGKEEASIKNITGTTVVVPVMFLWVKKLYRRYRKALQDAAAPAIQRKSTGIVGGFVCCGPL